MKRTLTLPSPKGGGKTSSPYGRARSLSSDLCWMGWMEVRGCATTPFLYELTMSKPNSESPPEPPQFSAFQKIGEE